MTRNPLLSPVVVGGVLRFEPVWILESGRPFWGLIAQEGVAGGHPDTLHHFRHCDGPLAVHGNQGVRL